jgi:hypothetical protein
MGSVSNGGLSRDAIRRRQVAAYAARQVAYEFGLPWELLTLREHAWRYVSRSGVVAAWEDYDNNLALSPPSQAFISKELSRYATALRKRKEEDPQRLPPTELSPALEQAVGAAYNAYSKDKWKNIIPKLDYTDLRPLLLYLRDREGELSRARLPWMEVTDGSSPPVLEAEELYRLISESAAAVRSKYGVVFEAARRSMILLFSQGEWEGTRITDPFWAALWAEVGAPPTSRQRTPAELHKPRAIAEALGHNPDNKHKQVAEWLERMDALPFHEYEEKHGGGPTDYLFWVCRPRLYNKIHSQRKKRVDNP